MSARKKSALNLQDESSFAFDKAPLEAEKGGRLLIICGQEYKAWYHDGYIYDALQIAGFWEESERSYKRIVHLRTWLRENDQHGHNIPGDPRSLKGAKLFIDKIIRAEYQYAGDNGAEKKFQLQRNAEIMI